MIAPAKAGGKPADGHAPGLRGGQAASYAAAGITTDHECFSLEEAQDKLAAVMKILIREGPAARNFAALLPLLQSHPDPVMFCSTTLHLLLGGHIDRHVRRLATGRSVRRAAVRVGQSGRALPTRCRIVARGRSG